MLLFGHVVLRCQRWRLFSKPDSGGLSVDGGSVDCRANGDCSRIWGLHFSNDLGWAKPICIGRHAFGDQYRLTDTVIKGAEKLKFVFVMGDQNSTGIKPLAIQDAFSIIQYDDAETDQDEALVNVQIQKLNCQEREENACVHFPYNRICIRNLRINNPRPTPAISGIQRRDTARSPKVSRDLRWGRSYESCSENTEIVRKMPSLVQAYKDSHLKGILEATLFWLEAPLLKLANSNL
ncbi:hypothetical protein ACS0TY_027920 [Phlomoides rotata]